MGVGVGVGVAVAVAVAVGVAVAMAVAVAVAVAVGVGVDVAVAVGVGVDVAVGVGVDVAVGVGVGVVEQPLTALPALIRPWAQKLPVPGMLSAVVSMRLRTLLAPVPWQVAQTKAASPATKGVAMEVPFFAA